MAIFLAVLNSYFPFWPSSPTTVGATGVLTATALHWMQAILHCCTTSTEFTASSYGRFAALNLRIEKKNNPSYTELSQAWFNFTVSFSAEPELQYLVVLPPGRLEP